MSSDLQRDIAEVDFLVAEFAGIEITAAWQRIRARLTPDRERVARAIYAGGSIPSDPPWEVYAPEAREYFLALADAAIDAMGETP